MKKQYALILPPLTDSEAVEIQSTLLTKGYGWSADRLQQTRGDLSNLGLTVNRHGRYFSCMYPFPVNRDKLIKNAMGRFVIYEKDTVPLLYRWLDCDREKFPINRRVNATIIHSEAIYFFGFPDFPGISKTECEIIYREWRLHSKDTIKLFHGEYEICIEPDGGIWIGSILITSDKVEQLFTKFFNPPNEEDFIPPQPILPKVEAKKKSKAAPTHAPPTMFVDYIPTTLEEYTANEVAARIVTAPPLPPPPPYPPPEQFVPHNIQTVQPNWWTIEPILRNLL